MQRVVRGRLTKDKPETGLETLNLMKNRLQRAIYVSLSPPSQGTKRSTLAQQREVEVAGRLSAKYEKN